ncbi:hypothetical protein HDV00_012503 [Rhizophlyctis rosea]|nr:hypothetical protein HDV00_012503 [Rhizophlyctis rosea]
MQYPQGSGGGGGEGRRVGGDGRLRHPLPKPVHPPTYHISHMAHAASALAPITGRFRKRLLFDLVGSLTLGTGLAYAYWYKMHLPQMAMYKAYDAKCREESKKIYAEWVAAGNEEGSQIEWDIAQEHADIFAPREGGQPW